ncbi:hypothetical protein [Acidocella sp.]|uniref:hypothetical protein n=1 Tax=Acidocella sp. TaxID=50710 RepID=UPI0026236363|nr:hypothetical protein [Acidocella sp.]
MSPEVKAAPFYAVRCQLAALLESLGGGLANVLDMRLDGLLEGPHRADLMGAQEPERRLIFAAQQHACALRLVRPSSEPYDAAQAYVGHCRVHRGSGAGQTLGAVSRDMKKGLHLARQLLAAHMRAMLADD